MHQLDGILKALKINGQCVCEQSNRHMSFFDIKLNPGATVRRLESHTKEIALHLRSKTTPIVKLMPDSGVVRLQVAMKEAETLPLNSIYDSSDAPQDALLPFLLGEADDGRKLWIDLAKHPHTLVAGGTGSGKSVFLHLLIANILRLSRSIDIELFLIDPKRVEFAIYDNPETCGLVRQVGYTYDDAVSMLDYLEQVMELRYAFLAANGLTSIADRPGIFPYQIVIIDEVADLMVQDRRSKRFESRIVRLAQKCRAAGMYLVLATQRPSADVLTGLIKANFPARISCKVASRVDSQVVLDAPGAENLLGRGDALLQSMEHDRARFQVAFVSPQDNLKLFSNL